MAAFRKIMDSETKPVKFPESNCLLVGGTGVTDLPVLAGQMDGVGDVVISCWRIPFWKRVKLLFTGRVWLCVKGQTHPPLYIETEI